MMITKQVLMEMLSQVFDPEIPVLSLVDLGVIRNVTINEVGVNVVITPTYLGCPAVDVMKNDVLSYLSSNGIKNVTITEVLSPAWTTDWITKRGRKKLLEYGIAPPNETSLDKKVVLGLSNDIACPQCRSTKTKMISYSGSTACKSLYKCETCKEPFDYFKCI